MCSFLKVHTNRYPNFFCFIALCLSFKTLSYLLVPSEIPSRIFGSHPSESDDNSNISRLVGLPLKGRFYKPLLVFFSSYFPIFIFPVKEYKILLNYNLNDSHLIFFLLANKYNYSYLYWCLNH